MWDFFCNFVGSFVCSSIIMQNFALIGAAGYIAPRHIKAIADTGNNLMVAYDKFDSVGRLDSSFPDCSFFTENEQFDRFCSKQMRTDNPLHWVSICTPNYTHDAFIRYGLRLGCDVICEKPLVLNPYNIDNLMELEQETGHKAYTILQLRLHDKIRALKQKVDNGPKDKIYDVDLTYITSRAAVGVRTGAEEHCARHVVRPRGRLPRTRESTRALLPQYQCRLSAR